MEPGVDVRELVERYGLEEDMEHVIVPVTGRNGHTKRVFLLKRRFMRVVYPGGQYVDYPLEEVIEATVRYPELLLSEALYMMHREGDAARKAGEESSGVETAGEKGKDIETMSERFLE